MVCDGCLVNFMVVEFQKVGLLYGGVQTINLLL